MALLRMTLVALAACNAAGAEPAPAPVAAPPPAAAGSNPAMPAAWKALPPIAQAVADAAKADGVVIDTSDAWGDPAIGCYAVQLALHGGDAPVAALADQVLDGLAAPGAGSAARLTLAELVKPSAGNDALGFAFTRPPYRGQVRARLGAGRITALACFGNQREPTTCDAACARMLQGSP